MSLQKMVGNATLARWAPGLAGGSALVLLAGLFVGGAQPAAVGFIAAPWDKLVHALVFGVLTVLLTLALGGRVRWAVALAILVGALDEWHQGFLPGRLLGLGDWVADVLGALLAGRFFVSVQKRWLVR